MQSEITLNNICGGVNNAIKSIVPMKFYNDINSIYEKSRDRIFRMDNNEFKSCLYPHNKPYYKYVEKTLLLAHKCCYIAGTGTGKSFIAMEFMKKFKLKTLVICPNDRIVDRWNSFSEDCNLITAITYHYFTRHYSKYMEYDMYVFDEVHHAGGKVWKESIGKFLKRTNSYILGITESPFRYFDCECSDVTKEFFYRCVVNGPTKADAIRLGLVPNVAYTYAMFDQDGDMFDDYVNLKMTPDLKKKLKFFMHDNRNYIMNVLKENTRDIDNIKGIVFVSHIKDIPRGIKLIEDTFEGVPVFGVHSKMDKEIVRKNIENFKNSKNGFIVNVNMMAEGVHVPGTNTIIMLRKTASPTLYNQQIGRAFDAAVGCKNIAIFDFACNINSVSDTLNNFEFDMKHSVMRNLFGASYTDREYRHTDTDKLFGNQVILNNYVTDVFKVLNDIREFNANDKEWAVKDDMLLTDNYPNIEEEVYDMFKDKTKKDIDQRIEYLGLESKKWTKEEDDILRKRYPEIGSDCMAYLPNRTSESIDSRARYLNILHIVWTEYEDDILIKRYPNIGVSCSRYFKDKNESLVRNRAIELGLKTFCNWSDEEDDIMKKYYAKDRKKCIYLLADRTIRNISTRAFILKV